MARETLIPWHSHGKNKASEPWVCLGIWSPNAGLPGGVGLPGHCFEVWFSQSFFLCLLGWLVPHVVWLLISAWASKIPGQGLPILQDTCLQPRVPMPRMWHKSSGNPSLHLIPIFLPPVEDFSRPSELSEFGHW